ncbi:3-keto-5-aminohexanoate cleavage protein [Budviciaceae bacterium CWB-B4]|uniref:3-keto-5-aminohexanoate cleavage protein n=1 Tax=Limnobaculum xujianqingii TaxID=2738837 RepID=A0A9D7AK00_9GAMM|nr:3-keto-5-aminohexanoate cleavage protein [Limnobaculum xujianqingii]MBK5074290.1 3-keto-5-aminohexanoate cleavage protein [Limnobaculum xujianqingii]MBK5177599.1 3-keto-5-aminohexanoate cleavage protein [Limnobaculum xujianqingii]
MSDKVIISVAPVSASSTRVLPEEVAREVIKSADYGAAIVHLHVRDTNGALTPDVSDFQQTINAIHQNTNLIIQASTGGVSSMTIEQRCAPLECPHVEMASLNVGSVNLGTHIYMNPADDVRYCSKRIVDKRIIPEFEVFELGMVHNINILMEEINFVQPMLYNIVLGHKGSTPATIDMLIAMRQAIPAGALWGITHFDRRDFSLIAAAVGMGACEVRIGFEDSYYINATEKVEENYLLVNKLATLIKAMDKQVATPDEARKMLGIATQK